MKSKPIVLVLLYATVVAVVVVVTLRKPSMKTAGLSVSTTGPEEFLHVLKTADPARLGKAAAYLEWHGVTKHGLLQTNLSKVDVEESP